MDWFSQSMKESIPDWMNQFEDSELVKYQKKTSQILDQLSVFPEISTPVWSDNTKSDMMSRQQYYQLLNQCLKHLDSLYQALSRFNKELIRCSRNLFLIVADTNKLNVDEVEDAYLKAEKLQANQYEQIDHHRQTMLLLIEHVEQALSDWAIAGTRKKRPNQVHTILNQPQLKSQRINEANDIDAKNIIPPIGQIQSVQQNSSDGFNNQTEISDLLSLGPMENQTISPINKNHEHE